MKICRPYINYEVFEDEIVIVNLLTGNYYSLSQAGMPIWMLIEKGYSEDQIVKVFKKRFSIETTDHEIREYIKKLVNEGLVTVEPETGSDPEVNPIEALETYHPPVIEKYTDMQDLILLDPIHDIDETGWPGPVSDSQKNSENNKNEPSGAN